MEPTIHAKVLKATMDVTALVVGVTAKVIALGRFVAAIWTGLEMVAAMMEARYVRVQAFLISRAFLISKTCALPVLLLIQLLNGNTHVRRASISTAKSFSTIMAIVMKKSKPTTNARIHAMGPLVISGSLLEVPRGTTFYTIACFPHNNITRMLHAWSSLYSFNLT